MSLRTFIYPPVANTVYRRHVKKMGLIVEEQKNQLKQLLYTAKDTEFGKKHSFGFIKNYNDYKNNVPLQHYNHLAASIEKMGQGQADILWPGVPKYFAATSGTLSGKKFIPISTEGLKSQKMGRLTAMANYSMKYNKLNQLKGPMLFFSARPSFVQFGKYKARLVSALMAETIPNWMKKYNLPSGGIYEIENFGDRIDFMVKEALANKKDLRGIVAFPPWLQLFLNQLQLQNDLDFEKIFPNFSLLVTSGMSYKPYEQIVREKMGKHFDHLETFPSSEGFIGFKDTLNEPGMSFMPSNGVFYEFVKIADVNKENAERIGIEETETNTEYALLLTTNSGLWSYVLGDTVKFIQTHPWKFVVTGRVGRTLSLVAEHVTIGDADACIDAVCKKQNVTLHEYICSGNIPANGEKPRYEWIVECSNFPENKEAFAKALHVQMMKLNVLYEEVSEDGVMDVPIVYFVPPGSFMRYLNHSLDIDAQQKLEHICADYIKFCNYKRFMFENLTIPN